MLKAFFNLTGSRQTIENGESVVVTKFLIQSSLFPVTTGIFEADKVTPIVTLVVTASANSSNFELTTNFLASKGVSIPSGTQIFYNHGAP